MEGHGSCQSLCMCVHAYTHGEKYCVLEKEYFFIPIVAFHPHCLLPELSIYTVKC